MVSDKSKNPIDGQLFIISSVAGGGKSTLINLLTNKYPDILFSISSTTRSPRPGDEEGKTYNFLTKEEFENAIKQDRFLEWALVHGNYYGTPRKFIEDGIHSGHSVVLDIDVQGASLVKAKMPHSKSIFILPPSEEIWIRRLKGRGTDSEESINRRIENGKKELLEASKFDYRIINDNLDDAFLQLVQILGLG
ncbi:guanylate kinase [Leptospira sp. GIMC2001]|uniref:guanylate kinase n=1 Tax=Leptospira sp. GIMC2001 TaxID=1513297 RepID=UPI002349F5C0|nr:guanylate kinase [Leptospira sp. GIMC2001]WCL48262.1 guanylate kinase [Leptospira sp. GIMC2001]